MADIQMLTAIPQTPAGGESGLSKGSENGATEAFGQALTHAKTSFNNDEQTSKKYAPSKPVTRADRAEGAEKGRDRATRATRANKNGMPKLPTSSNAQKNSDFGADANHVFGETNASADIAATVAPQSSDSGQFHTTADIHEDTQIFYRQNEAPMVARGQELVDSGIGRIVNSNGLAANEAMAELASEHDGAKSAATQDSQGQQLSRQAGQVAPAPETGKQIAIDMDNAGGETEPSPELASLLKKAPAAANPEMAPQNGQASNAPEASANTAQGGTHQVQGHEAADSNISQGDAGKALSVRSEVVAELPADISNEKAPLPQVRTAPIEIESALPRQDAEQGKTTQEEGNQGERARNNDEEQGITSKKQVNANEQDRTHTKGEAAKTKGNGASVKVDKSTEQSTQLPERTEGSDRAERIRPEHRQQGQQVAEQPSDARSARSRRSHDMQNPRNIRNEQIADAGEDGMAARGARRARILSSQTLPEKVQVGSAPIRVDVGQHQLSAKESGRAQESRNTATENNAGQRPEAVPAKALADQNASNNSDNPSRHRAAVAQEARPVAGGSVSVSHTAPFSVPGASGPNTAPVATPMTPEAAPKHYLPPQAPMAQLEGSVKWLLRNDAKMAEIQLYPEHLGRVTVRLRIEGNEVHARIWASEASTIPMLKEHRAFLESSLKDQGLNLSSFDLQQGRGGQQAEGDNRNGQNHTKGQHFHFAPQMMESWNGSEFRQELPIQLTTQRVDDGRVELYA